MYHRIQIERRVVSIGTRGDQTTWVPWKRLWANVEMLQGKELEIARQVISTVTTKIKTHRPRDWDLDETYRVIHDGVVYAVQYAIGVGPGEREIEMLCEKLRKAK